MLTTFRKVWEEGRQEFLVFLQLFFKFEIISK